MTIRSEERGLNAAGPGELPRLEALATEDRTSLRGSKRDRRFFSARRAIGRRLHTFAAHRRTTRTRRRARRALRLAALAPFGFVLEVLVGEEELLARRPDELRAAVHAVEGLVLELHRPYLPLTHSTICCAPWRRATAARFQSPVCQIPDGTANRKLATRPDAASPTRGAASSASVCAPAPASRGADRPASDRTNVS